MIFSEVSDVIIQAYSKFLKMVSTPKQSRQNTHLKNHYSTIDDVKGAVDPALESNGLMIIQSPTHEPGQPSNVLLMETRVIHIESGQYVSDICQIPLAKTDCQGFGSALTYARRYAQVTMFGLKMKDDDGNKSIRTAADWKEAIETLETADQIENLMREAFASFGSDEASLKVLRIAAAERKTAIKMGGKKSFNPAAPKNALKGKATVTVAAVTKLDGGASKQEPEPPIDNEEF